VELKMACNKAAVAHLRVLANHTPVKSKEHHVSHYNNQYLGQDSKRANHEYKSETLPLHATLSLTSTDESGSNDPTVEIEVALGHGTRSAQARDKKPTAHPNCMKTKIKNVKFNKPFQV
jgi:hypothetical protein